MENSGGRMLYTKRSMALRYLNLGFHRYSSSYVGGGASAGRSSEFLLDRLFGNRGGKAFAAARLWSIRRYCSSVNQTTAAEVPSIQRLPTPPIHMSPPVSLSSPWMKICRCAETEAEAETEYYKFLSIADEKGYWMKKQLRAGWERELLTPDDAVCLSSSHGWLAFIDPATYHPYLFNPFVATPEEAYIPLPTLETLGNIKAVRSFKADKLSPSSRILKDFMTRFDDHLSSELVTEGCPIRKLAMSSTPRPTLSSSNNNGNGNGNRNCTVVTIVRFNAFFCVPGRDEEGWTRCEAEGMYEVTDLVEIVYFSKDGRFYSLDCFGELNAFDLTDPSCPKTELLCYSSSLPRPDGPRDANGLYLVECSGDLLLLWATKSGYKFHVYRFDFDKYEWEAVNCVGENALFVGRSHSFSLSTRDHPQLEPNSIYFTENDTKTHVFGVHEEFDEVEVPDFDNGVFYLKDRSTNLYHSVPGMKDLRNLGAPDTLWVAPNTA